MSQLPYSVNKDHIRAFFEKVGCVIKSCRVVLKSGKFTGVAFLDVMDKKSVELGVTLHRSLFRDRKINVRPTVTQGELSQIAAERERHVANLPRPVCYGFMEGTCNRGDACKYSHDIEAPRSKKPKAAKADLLDSAEDALTEYEQQRQLEAPKHEESEEEDSDHMEAEASIIKAKLKKKRDEPAEQPKQKKAKKQTAGKPKPAEDEPAEQPKQKKAKKQTAGKPTQRKDAEGKKATEGSLPEKKKEWQLISKEKSPGMAALLKRKKAQLQRQMNDDN